MLHIYVIYVDVHAPPADAAKSSGRAATADMLVGLVYR